MARKLRRRGFAALAGAMIVAGPVVAACSQGPTFDQWAATDGAAGRINLDDVQEAFKKSKSASEFERRVNEIYEGDEILLIRAEQNEQGLTLDAYEDLNKSGDIEDSQDDLLFSITGQDGNNELRGHGTNGYYNRGFGGGDFLFTYLILSSFSRGPYFYHTPRGNASRIRTNRNNYRASSSYRSQVSRNSSYFNRRGGFSQSRYNSARGNVSSSRQTYQSTQRTSGAFKNSGTGVRSSWGSRTGGSRFSSRGGRSGGGFRGFGGGQVVIGLTRE